MKATAFSAFSALAAWPVAVSGQAAGYRPHAVTPRDHAGYVMSDGAIQVVASAPMAGVVAALNRLFVATHSGVKFRLLKGDNYSAMATLTFDRTAFAPLGCEYTRIGLGDNLKVDAEPMGFRIAHASLTPGTAVPALGVIVNPANPLASLRMSRLVRIFAVGGSGGDLVTWGQAGVAGPLADREIRPIGPYTSDEMNSDDPQAGEFIGTDMMGGLNMNHRYVALAHYADIVQRVREDPAAIGIAALNMPLDGVKVVALGRETGQPSLGTPSDIATGRYPFDRFIYIYLRVGKGQSPDAFGEEYMRMVLSDEGQRVIAADPEGYIPLSAGELAEERARLDP